MKELKELKLLDTAKLVTLEKDKLQAELQRSEKNLFVLRMKKQKGELKQTHLITFLRKYIAQINTAANS